MQKKTKKILLLNGPNLNLLGQRQVHLYGIKTLVQIEENLLQLAENFQFSLFCFQSNCEGDMISFLHQHYLSKDTDAIIANFAAWTHTSIALRDAVELFTSEKIPLIEVHLSNIYQRENFRHHSYFSKLATGVISGLGDYGYEAALSFLKRYYE